MILENYFAAVRDAVKYYPIPPKAEDMCEQPQTFVVLEALSDMSMENLGRTPCDRGKPYFYSRLWEDMKYNPSKIAFKFPLVGLLELSGESYNAFARDYEQCHNFQLVVVDTFSENCLKGKCSGCDGRNGNEIFRDTEIMLNKVLKYLSSCNAVRYDGNTELFLHPQSLSDELVAKNVYTTYETDVKETNMFQKSLRDNNKNPNIFRFAGRNGGGKTVNDLYGTVINLRFCLNRCIDAFTPNYRIGDFGVTKDIGCCS